MGFFLLEDVIEISPASLRKYNQNMHTLHALCYALNNALEDSKHFVEQVESFMASSFTLAGHLYKIGLQLPEIGELSSSISHLNKEINQLLPQSLRDCKIILEYSLENSASIDQTEMFKNIKSEIDKQLGDSNQYRRELKSLLSSVYQKKSISDSSNDKISSIMAKLSHALFCFEKYSQILETELDEFCGGRQKYLYCLSRNILNLQYLVHFGKITKDSQNPNQESSLIRKTLSNESISASFTKKTSLQPPSSINDILTNSIFLKAFRIFSEKQHGLENLLFYIDSQTLKELESKSNHSKEEIRTMFLNMYNNYVVPGSSFEINIDAGDRVAIDERRLNLFTDDDFYPSLQGAIETISSLLNLSLLPNFLKSPLYQAALVMSKGYHQNIAAGVEPFSNMFRSLETLLNHPIGLEYFLFYLKPNPSTSPSASGQASYQSSASVSINISPNTSAPSSTSTSPTSLSPLAAALLSPKYSPLLSPNSISTVSLKDARNMVFLVLEIGKLKELSDDNIEYYSNELYETYLKPGAEKEISSISSNESVRSPIQVALGDKTKIVSLYDNLAQDIILQLTTSHFQPFLSSQLCKDLQAREEKMLKYLEKEKKKPETKIELQFENMAKEKLNMFLKGQQHTSKSKLNPPASTSTDKQRASTVIGGVPFTHYVNTPYPTSSNNISVSANNTNNSNNGGLSQSLSTVPTLPLNIIGNNNNNSSNSGTLSPHSPPPLLFVPPPSSVPTSSNSTPAISSTSTTPLLTSVSSSNSMGSSGGGSSSSNSISTTNINTSSNIGPPTPPKPVLKHTESMSSLGGETKPNEVFIFILSDSTWLDTFKRFVKIEKCEELLLCWMDLERYCRGRPSMPVATNIYDNFFRSGSPLEVNLDEELKVNFTAALKGQNQTEIDEQLKNCCQAAFELLRVDCFGRFIKSSTFKELSAQIGDPFDPKYRKKVLSKK